MTELQSKLVEMLLWLDSFLGKNNLTYFLISELFLERECNKVCVNGQNALPLRRLYADDQKQRTINRKTTDG